MPDVTQSTPKAVIFGCSGLTLTAEETAFFADSNPFGFILFARNCQTPNQIASLVQALRASVGRDDAPVMIDQEGGRVQRLGPPHWKKRPAQGMFAKIAGEDLTVAVEAARLNAQLIAEDLIALGIDVNCLPLLDVPVPGAHDIIGNRAFGNDPELIATLGAAVIEGLALGGVMPVIKHIPGHGRSMADSHLSLPRVDASLEDLRKTDFAPFKNLNGASWGMTAHIVYEALDADLPATLSKKVISDVIRDEIGFQGFLVSDDVNMKALTGSIADNSIRALDAGCDAVLHCNGELDEMITVAAELPELSAKALERFKIAKRHQSAKSDVDVDALEVMFDRVTAKWRNWA